MEIFTCFLTFYNIGRGTVTMSQNGEKFCNFSLKYKSTDWSWSFLQIIKTTIYYTFFFFLHGWRSEEFLFSWYHRNRIIYWLPLKSHIRILCNLIYKFKIKRIILCMLVIETNICDWYFYERLKKSTFDAPYKKKLFCFTFSWCWLIIAKEIFKFKL